MMKIREKEMILYMRFKSRKKRREVVIFFLLLLLLSHFTLKETKEKKETCNTTNEIYIGKEEKGIKISVRYRSSEVRFVSSKIKRNNLRK